jgi:hypothetical protein
MPKTTEQQITALFIQALRTALALIDGQAPKKNPRRGRNAVRELPTGIYPATSKYNPYRAYVMRGATKVYLGMFPSVAAAKRAQKEYLSGQQPSAGTRVANHRAPLRVVKKAA